MLKKLRSLLDKITMYRIVLSALVSLAAIALLFSALGILSYSSFGTLLISLGLIAVTCFATNFSLSKLYKVTPNFESSMITTLILFLVLAAPTKKSDYAGIVFAAIVAMASKYVVTWKSAHIFNPAAFGVLAVSILNIGSGAWWIADRSLFIPMLVIGFIVLLKIRRFQLFLSFLIPALFIIIAKDTSGLGLSSIVTTALTLYPLLFLGSIMLTEPNTMPTTENKRLLFGAIVGILFAANLDIGPLAASPHLALIVGNFFAFAVSNRSSARMKLVSKTQLTPTTYNFSFKPNRPLKHAAGQYIEITLPGVKIDTRGNRRTFTIASSPRSDLIQIGVKFYDKGSQFKKKLLALQPGDVVMGSHVSGDFTLPKTNASPIVLVAGGIGVTPFIAMLEEMIANKTKQAVDLYYFASDKSEIAFKDVLKKAQEAGVKIHPRIGPGLRLTDEDMRSHKSAHFYLSGPPGMVNGYKAQLQKMNIKRIHTDLFTGY